MNFIIDANLPVALCSVFGEHDVIHTLHLPDSNLTKDRMINEISIFENRILITKDTDFYYSFIASRKPFKLILVKLGNMRLRDLLSYFRKNSETIFKLISEHSFLIIETEKIRILE